MMTVGFAGTIINQFLKLWFRIPRPWVKDPNFTIVEAHAPRQPGYSFPSGHTQNAFAVFGAPARFFKNTALRIIFILLIALTAFSRMYVGVHTPLDVGVSIIVGTILVFVIYPFFRDMDKSPKKGLHNIQHFHSSRGGICCFRRAVRLPCRYRRGKLRLGP